MVTVHNFSYGLLPASLHVGGQPPFGQLNGQPGSGIAGGNRDGGPRAGGVNGSLWSKPPRVG